MALIYGFLAPSTRRQLWNRSYSDREIIDLLREATRGVRHRKVGRDEIVRAVDYVIGTALPEQRKGEARKEKVVYEPDIYPKSRANHRDVDEAYLEASVRSRVGTAHPPAFSIKFISPRKKSG